MIVSIIDIISGLEGYGSVICDVQSFPKEIIERNVADEFAKMANVKRDMIPKDFRSISYNKEYNTQQDGHSQTCIPVQIQNHSI